MAAQVRTYLDANGLDGELRAPADISFDGDTLVQPDMFVADLGTFTQTWNWADIRTFHLVVEVVSPSTAKSDRTTKRRLYQQQRVPEYWIVDTDQRHVEVWTPAAAFPVIERECPRWQHPQVSVECEIDLIQLFSL